MPVIDASLAVDWVVPDTEPASSSMRTLRRLAAEDEELFGPRLLRQEVANSLVTGIRRRRWTGAQADESFAALRRLPLHLVDESPHLERAWELARRHDNHPVYDMVYVALAEHLRTTLITADDTLLRHRARLTWIVPLDA